RKVGDLHVHRVTVASKTGPEASRQIVIRHQPLLMDLDKDETEHPLILAKYASEFQKEFWDQRANDWVDEWKQTNQLPKLVKFSLKLADNAYQARQAQQEIVRIVSLPATTVLP